MQLALFSPYNMKRKTKMATKNSIEEKSPPEATASKNVLLLNGPNLNMLGVREPTHYGSTTLEKLTTTLTKLAGHLGLRLTHVQSNAEHELIDALHRSLNKIDFIIINPAGFTHTSVALRDAILAVDIPFIEVHLSNIYAREPFRHHSYFSDKAIGVISGLGVDGYEYALTASAKWLTCQHTQHHASAKAK